MSAPRQTRMIVLFGVLVFLLAFVAYRTLHLDQTVSAVSDPNARFVPLSVENPELRLDLLKDLRNLQYNGPKRNIFLAIPPAPPAPPKAAIKAGPVLAPPPPPPPPVVVPATYFGYVADVNTGVRRAFFNSGDDVYVIGVGDILLGRFRLLTIGNNTAELEELSSGRKATVVLQENGNSPS